MNKLERAALRDVNRIRKAEGRKPLKRLPKGDVNEEYSCPIARGLNHGKVGIGQYVEIPARKLAAYLAAGLKLGEETVQLEMPKSFDKFVEWFDAQDDKAAKELRRE